MKITDLNNKELEVNQENIGWLIKLAEFAVNEAKPIGIERLDKIVTAYWKDRLAKLLAAKEVLENTDKLTNMEQTFRSKATFTNGETVFFGIVNPDLWGYCQTYKTSLIEHTIFNQK